MIEVLKFEERPDHLTITLPYDEIEGARFAPPISRHDLDALNDTVCNYLFPSLGLNPVALRMRKPPKYYSYAMAEDDLGIYIAYGIERQKWMIQFHGRWWQANPDGNPDLMLVGTQGVHATRFDWSTTVMVSEKVISPARELYQWGQYLQVLTGRTTPRWYFPHAEIGEETYYAGSRRSRQMIRVYDKAYWPDSDSNTFRIEAEYKKDLGEPMFQAWAKGEEGLTAASLVFGWYEDRSNWHAYLDAMSGHVGIEAEIPPVPKHESSYATWFNKDVKSAFQSWAGEDPVAARVWAHNAVYAWTDLYTMPDEMFKHLVEPD